MMLQCKKIRPCNILLNVTGTSNHMTKLAVPPCLNRRIPFYSASIGYTISLQSALRFLCRLSPSLLAAWHRQPSTLPSARKLLLFIIARCKSIKKKGICQPNMHFIRPYMILSAVYTAYPAKYIHSTLRRLQPPLLPSIITA